ncbi:NME6 [Cordylochernes scorpioides]|uniref:Nucleoside diphosphate kinase n=1 Tax=Cordylochernes scorpioides TaxID=51811 RepID=A0ABY6KBN4_9ARAC|nr:NME6 [Cordylochernes scorpioides]
MAKLVKPSLELTLAILKPNIANRPLEIECLRRLLLGNNYYFVKTKRTKLTKEKAEEFYQEHEGKFFYNRLVTFMASDNIWIHILARENAIRHWRQLMGPTKVFRTILEAPTCLRAEYGLTDTRNSFHGSDSPETVKKEVEFFFPEFNMEAWQGDQLSLFQSGQAVLDTSLWEHRPPL